jgi:Tol biopolymer transport system component/DNA-binding winged helix-turn-helix (wHTH) protein
LQAVKRQAAHAQTAFRQHLVPSSVIQVQYTTLTVVRAGRRHATEPPSFALRRPVVTIMLTATENEPTTYHFGPFRINNRDRLLLRGDQLVALPPKSADALLLLLNHPGQVIGKQELLQALWPGVAVQEGSVTQCIWQLRKALDEGGDGSSYIQTIPRRGYRWVHAVDVGPDTNETSNVTTERVEVRSSHSHRARRAWVLAAIAVTGMAAVGAFVESRDNPEIPVMMRPFTTYQGGEYEPAFSPDGSRLAFVWDGPGQNNFDIYVRSSTVADSSGADETIRLTSDAAGEGSPAWSPDGRNIGFVRYGTRQAGSSGVFVLPVNGGSPRKITAILPLPEIHDRHLDWSPATQDLAFVDKTTPEAPFAILIVPATAHGTRRQLTHPPANSHGDTGPAFSPDGRFIAFRRTLSAGVNDIYIVPAQGGTPHRLTSDNRFTSAHAWSADGKQIVFSSNRTGRLELWRIDVSGGGPLRAGPWGEGANFLTISRHGRRLAYSQWFADTNIWSVDLSARPVRPRQVIASTRSDASPAIAPDGSRLAFRSDRSGATEIWVSLVDGSDQHPITSFGGPLTGSPAWSPDGAALAFDSRPSERGQIFTKNLKGKTLTTLTDGVADDVVPSWSRDGQWIYFSSNRTGSWQVWKVRRDGGPAVQVTQTGGFAPQESSDGEWVYYAKGPNTRGLWRLASRGGHEQPVSDRLAEGLWRYWMPHSDGIYFVEPGAGSTADIVLHRPETGAFRGLAVLSKLPIFHDGGSCLSPDGRSIFYSQADQNGSDILVVDGFR